MAADRVAWMQECNEYLGNRVSGYVDRCQRYNFVAEFLLLNGVQEWDVLYDLGAGMCELDRRLRELDLHLRYVPVDGCIDGTDLDEWEVPPADWFVMIEVIEHLNDPFKFLSALCTQARKGVILTTPNAECVDTFALDSTHKSAFVTEDFSAMGWEVTTARLYTPKEDTIVARWRA